MEALPAPLHVVVSPFGLFLCRVLGLVLGCVGAEPKPVAGRRARQVLVPVRGRVDGDVLVVMVDAQVIASPLRRGRNAWVLIHCHLHTIFALVYTPDCGGGAAEALNSAHPPRSNQYLVTRTPQRSDTLTDEERDNILLELRAGQKKHDKVLLELQTGVKRLEVYVHAIAGRLLAPTEIAEIEEEARSIEQERVPA